MEKEATMGRVLPFARSADYLRKLAQKLREQGKNVQALELLRISLKQEPGDAQGVMDLAETYAQMQCPSLSNRALFSLLKDEDIGPECFYGVGCNYYAMHVYGCARDCLVLYLNKHPDGPYVPEALDLIETIDSEAEISGGDLEARITRRMERALDSMDADKPMLAVRQLRRVLSLEKRNGGAHALMAFALLNAGEAKAALDAARNAMRCNRRDIRALCALSAALKANGSAEVAHTFLQRAMDQIENEEDLQLVCQTACEMGEHSFVKALLTRMEAQSPYADELLHLSACACYNTGDTEEAKRKWRLLTRIDPMDSIAEYRLKTASEDGAPATFSYQRQVPLTETLARLSRLRGWVQEGAEALTRRFEEGEELERLLRWGLTSPESGVPEAMMGVLSTFTNQHALGALKDLLCDAVCPDTVKHSALAALCMMGESGPYYALIGGRLTMVRVSKTGSAHEETYVNTLENNIMQRLLPLTRHEKEQVQRLYKIAMGLPGTMTASMRIRAVELAFRKLRGETVTYSVKAAQRRKLERHTRRIIREVNDGMHQF